MRQQRAQTVEAQRTGYAQQYGQPQAVLDQARDTCLIARAMADGDQAAHRGDHPGAEDREDEIAGGTQCTTGQLLRAEHGHHQRVGENHQRVGQLCGDQRAGQTQQRTQFVAKGILHDE